MTEAWRYRCPECGSVSLRPRQQTPHDYRCNECKAEMQAHERVDMKTQNGGRPA